jgi:hypothetical protein
MRQVSSREVVGEGVKHLRRQLWALDKKHPFLVSRSRERG